MLIASIARCAAKNACCRLLVLIYVYIYIYIYILVLLSVWAVEQKGEAFGT